MDQDILQFTYQERYQCICNESLNKATRSIVRPHRWGAVRFAKCPRCGSWCQSPQISSASLARWYDSNEYQGGSNQAGSAYINYLQDESHRLAEARQRVERDLASYLPESDGAVLEVGCATGSLLAVLREHGCKVHGIDLSPRFAEAAHSFYGLDITVGDLLAMSLPAHAFDMAIMLGTISNLWDLPASLGRIKEALKPGGVLIFNYPKADSLMAVLYGERFWMFAPSVSTLMTDAGCALAMQSAGFSVVHNRTDWQMPSFNKILSHAKVRALVPLFGKLGLGYQTLPFAIPLPGISLVCARVEED